MNGAEEALSLAFRLFRVASFVHFGVEDEQALVYEEHHRGSSLGGVVLASRDGIEKSMGGESVELALFEGDFRGGGTLKKAFPGAFEDVAIARDE